MANHSIERLYLYQNDISIPYYWSKIDSIYLFFSRLCIRNQLVIYL